MLPPATDDAAGSKAALRTRLRADRKRRTAAARAAAAGDLARVLRDLPELTSARTVAAYVPLPTEPDLAPTLAELRSRDVRVLLPVMRPDRDLLWRPLPGPALGDQDVPAARLAASPPAGPVSPDVLPPDLLPPEAVREADVLLVPALAVDRSGARLGQGGGSYDRVLRRVRPGTLVLAVLFDGELLDTLPVEAHDCHVAAAATPSGVIRLPSGPDRAAAPP